jgi:ribosomal protein S18 acetylase RimI-like enzyme
MHQIRTAELSDVLAICELWKEFMDFHGALDQLFTRSPKGHETFGEFVSGHIESEDSCVFVAEDAGEIVGYCVSAIAHRPPAFVDLDYGAIYDVAVTGKRRRGGIGRDLFEKTKEWFAGRGIKRLELSVAVRNETARSFWRKMGFEVMMERMTRGIG